MPRIDRRTLLGLAPLLMAGRPMAGQGPAVAPFALGPTEGELLHVGAMRDPVRIKVSPPGGGRFAMITQEMAPGSRVPVHLHEKEDEIIFIGRGEGTATIGDRTVALQAGSMLFVPQGAWHSGANTGSTTLVWVAIYSPSGFEGYFREIAVRSDTQVPPQRTAEEWAELDRRYGIRYPGR